MILNDEKIVEMARYGDLIEPFDANNVGPASIDLTLGKDFKTLKEKEYFLILDEISEENYKDCGGNIDCDGNLFMPGKSFVIATTKEKVNIPDYLAGFVQGRSSIGRTGLFVENAGFIDPGFSGQITLELFNASNKDYILEPGTKICQLILYRLVKPANEPYNDKYQGQKGATGSRLYLDKNE